MSKKTAKIIPKPLLKNYHTDEQIEEKNWKNSIWYL